MNCRTGEIGSYTELVKSGSSEDELLAIQRSQMTARQAARSAVSLHDNRSTLGKLRVDYNNMTSNQRKQFRKKLNKKK